MDSDRSCTGLSWGASHSSRFFHFLWWWQRFLVKSNSTYSNCRSWKLHSQCFRADNWNTGFRTAFRQPRPGRVPGGTCPRDPDCGTMTFGEFLLALRMWFLTGVLLAIYWLAD